LNEQSSRVDLPECVDVIVTETIGNFGLDEGLVGASIDARRRFLKDNGIIVPQSVELFVVPVELPHAYQRFDSWTSNLYGLDYSAVRSFAINNWHPVDLAQEAFLSNPVVLARVELAKAEIPDVSGEMTFTVDRDGVIHGIGGWFSAELAKGVLLSNAPPSATPSWRHVFFPLKTPLPVSKGDHCRARVRSASNGTFWSWQIERTTDLASDGSTWTRPFDHSTFLGFPLSEEAVGQRSASSTPKLSARGEAELFLLSLFDGARTIGELETELLQRYPKAFRSRAEAADFVGDAVARWS
jgi:protein arginine N-methyltransferase 1